MRLIPRALSDAVARVTEGRSGKWPAVRAAHLKRQPACAACGQTKELNVHHRIPFHVDPSLELSPENLITLCEHSPQSCHYHFGHCALSWKAFNPHVVEDAATFQMRRIEAVR